MNRPFFSGSSLACRDIPLQMLKAVHKENVTWFILRHRLGKDFLGKENGLYVPPEGWGSGKE